MQNDLDSADDAELFYAHSRLRVWVSLFKSVQ